MPPGTTFRTFIEAVQTGETNTTKALDVFFNNPGRHQNHPNRNDFKTRHAFDKLPQWAKTALGSALSAVELAHVDDWDNAQKDDVRDACDRAIDQRLTAVKFRWGPGTGPADETVITPPDNAGIIWITFKSARKNIRITGADDVTVDVT